MVEPKWPRLRKAIQQQGKRVRYPEQNFQKLEPRSIVTIAKRGKQGSGLREAPGFPKDENSKASRNKGGLRSGYLGGQFGTSRQETQQGTGPKVAQQDSGKWEGICSQDFPTNYLPTLPQS